MQLATKLKLELNMQKQQGFSLIEVLVTMVIISFGLLGIAGVIVNSMKNNQSSYARTQASVLANDIIDRMRANRVTAEGAVAPAANPYDIAIGTAVAAGNTVVLNDLSQWRTALAAAMPSGTGSVAMDATRKVRVVVQWNDARASGDSTVVGAGDGATTGRTAQQVIVETRL
jgi:type IV pilus assembly protein PilV